MVECLYTNQLDHSVINILKFVATQISPPTSQDQRSGQVPEACCPCDHGKVPAGGGGTVRPDALHRSAALLCQLEYYCGKPMHCMREEGTPLHFGGGGGARPFGG